MGFWSGVAKGLEQDNARRFESSEREAQQDFTLSRDEAQREFQRERDREALAATLRAQREQQAFTILSSRRGGRGGGSGGGGATSSGEGNSSLNYLTNFFASDPDADEDKIANLLSIAQEYPEFADNVVQALETRRKELGYDMSATQTLDLLEVWAPVITEEPDSAFTVQDLLLGNIDVTDDETYAAILDEGSRKSEDIDPAFKLGQTLTQEVADQQYEAYKAQVISLATEFADAEGDQAQRDAWEALNAAAGSDDVASRAGIDRLSQMFGTDAYTALEQSGNPLFNSLDQNWLIPKPADPETTVTENAGLDPVFASEADLAAAMDAEEVAEGDPIVFMGVETFAPQRSVLDQGKRGRK